jgi:hypothetical protein
MPQGTIHIDTALSDVSVGYKNGVYVAERVFPVVNVDHQTDKYYKHGKEIFTVRDDRRSPGGEARPSRWTLSNETYYCDGHALKDFVPREHSVNGDPQLDLLTDTTEVLTDQVLLTQEANLVTALAAGMTGASLAAQTSTHWDAESSGVSTNDPVSIIRTQAILIAKRIGMLPNVFTVSLSVWNAIRNNTKVKGLLTGVTQLEDALITPQQFATLIDVQEVLIASSVKNTANEGQTESLDFVWGETALLSYRPPAPGRKTLSLGYTFMWNKAFGTSQAQFVNRYYWEPNLADVVEVHKYYDQKIVDSGAGCLFTDCLT